MITVHDVTKRYGSTTAVQDLTFEVSPGQVTGFLGPNGAGKSTTMRMILGLDRPTSGETRINGSTYAALRDPLREVGALLDARALHPRRSARDHLLAMARSNAIPAGRVDEVLDTVGLTGVASRHAGTFSLGMGQRLGIAAALLGDPHTVLFDEPVNGLDPDGVRWVRGLARSLAAEGRTVFVSSHLMSEMQLTADQLIIIGRGRLIANAPINEVISSTEEEAAFVRTGDGADRTALRERLDAAGFTCEDEDGGVLVRGATTGDVGDLAHELGVRLHELRSVTPSLEDAYMRLTEGDVEYNAPEPGLDAEVRS
ncbi:MULTISPECIES: ATP-binding cassette domain-containing protein [unclassified Saccharopolyspora]|uniref:ATP-binding cassette domain-containing protein n=1 Tax=unclassified Saccharopolyspora TaxID=2646250 RepID=UPI001CD1D00E|nr:MULTISPECIES: ATP-binding cassette domain-containing protein [unclassified Saccharopolyspora]MCA1185156.1 ATP-binding cassette domain-containing protein [Saccharopolyspora sp. 6T]MCA1191368.1 ATP-binding cassette domain-containing protein [Saccharopolyspora sp. 6V]MCA1225030.1 ATP-binding cassette domain-containing protein [Saccharopolyspora sp. 6M]MCA1278478.1 ATP-binding cassette domain-containing protein [Saccharopolyspora sp. 7B]